MYKSIMIKLLVPVLLVFSAWVNADSSFKQVYVFGDSLSDTGNLASITGNFPSPPFYMNRVSNGAVAVEVMANKLGLSAQASLHLIGPEAGTNYAVARANAAGTEPIDLAAQTSIFLANHGYAAPEDALYVILIGGNDIRSARGVTDTNTANTIVDAAIMQISQTINQLARSGAHSFLLINAPDIGAIPETRILAQLTNDPGMIARATRLSKRFSKKLKIAIKHRDESDESDELDMDITQFNLLKFFNKLIKKGSKAGFSNTTDACFSSITFTFNPGCNFGQNFDQYIFFDEIHPTARVHAIIGNAFYQSLDHKEEHEGEDHD
ncbi:MAG TPA: hypothetical protein ENI64_03575 [Gammaproteobacteria bacterium]|nr:hypothetical protein [Gammaproteobacteria bacterium]